MRIRIWLGNFLKSLSGLALAAVWLAAMVGIGQLSGFGWGIVVMLTVALVVYTFWVRSWKRVSVIVGGFFCVAVLWFFALQPSNDREWWTETSILPRIEIGDTELRIEALRNFKWWGPDEFDVRWEDRSYNLSRLSDLELIVEPFGDSELAAHVMLGFGFEDGERLVVSAEARKEIGEDYDLLPGAFRQFELIYVFGTEDDLIKMRAIHRKSRLYAYPIRANQEFIKRLLIELCDSANQLREHPQFYATLRRNCATSLLRHIDEQLEEKVGLRKETLFPALTGELLYELGFMETEGLFEEAKERFRIDERAQRFAEDERFSEKIRIPIDDRVDL